MNNTTTDESDAVTKFLDTLEEETYVTKKEINLFAPFDKFKIDYCYYDGRVWKFGLKLREKNPIFEYTTVDFTDGLYCSESLYTSFCDEMASGNKDVLRVNFIKKALFNYITYDYVCGLWKIGDKETNIFAAYASNIRDCIDKLIRK